MADPIYGMLIIYTNIKYVFKVKKKEKNSKIINT